MAGIEKVVTARHIKELVEVQGKTHRKVSDISIQELMDYPREVSGDTVLRMLYGVMVHVCVMLTL